MKILSLLAALTLCVAGAGFAQTSGNRGTTTTNRPNSSNFGWQNRQQEAIEAQEKYVAELKKMSPEQWNETALAMMSFESGADEVAFSDVVRIGAAAADRKAVTRDAEGSTEKAPAWVVEFAKKKPKALTLTLTDPKQTQVLCPIDELLETGKGYVGVFFTQYELICVTRSAG